MKDPKKHDIVIAAQRTETVESGRYGSVLDVQPGQFVVGWLAFPQLNLPAAVETFARGDWEKVVGLVGRATNAEREAFEEGFRHGMLRAVVHVERLNYSAESPEPPAETRDLIARSLDKASDHWLDYAEEAWTKARKA